MTAILQKNAGGLGGAGSAPTTSLFVFCHGYGGNSEQLLCLSETIRSAFPQAATLLPDAPTLCPLNFRELLTSSRGRQWFPLSRPLPSRSPEAEAAAAWLNRRIDAELFRLGLAEDAVWFVGFSQGAMVCLLAGLTRPVAPCGIIGISGALLVPEGAFAPSCRPPVLLVHGADDSVVPAACSQDAARRLQDSGIDAQLTLLPGLDHVIDAEAAPHLVNFIAERVQ